MDLTLKSLGGDRASPGRVSGPDQAAVERTARYILSGCKPSHMWRCGIEYELIGFFTDSLSRLPIANLTELLRRFAEDFHGHVITDTVVIGAESDFGTVSLEPGGQLEFASRPASHLLDLDHDLMRFLGWLTELAVERNYVFLGIGFDPFREVAEQHWLEKPRYRALRQHFLTTGTGGWDMMARTAGIQASFDFSDEQDLVQKYALVNRAAPIAAAMFASSPFRDGRISGNRSERGLAWHKTDSDRTGFCAVAVTGDFTTEDYARHALGVPRIEMPWRADEDDIVHLSTLFFEARLRTTIETRSADSAPVCNVLAVAAFWKGLLYDAQTRAMALTRMHGFTFADLQRAQASAIEHGIHGRVGGENIVDVARELIALAKCGLTRADPEGRRYLDPLEERLAGGQSYADILLDHTRSPDEVAAAVLAHCRVA